MTVAELLKESRIKPYPPFSEKHVEINRTRYNKGEQHSFVLTEEEAVKQFGDREVWLAFHSEGTRSKTEFRKRRMFTARYATRKTRIISTQTRPVLT